MADKRRWWKLQSKELTLLALLFVLGTAAVLLAGPLAPPSGPTAGADGVLNPFLAGQPAKAAEVNHNFKVLAEAVNAVEAANAALKQRLDTIEAQLKVVGDQVAIGTATPAQGAKLTVAGRIKADGLEFLDGSVQQTAYDPPVISGLRLVGKNSGGFWEYENPKDGSVLVHLPGGTFKMGTSDFGAVHDVTLSAFLIGKHEVTWGQWVQKYVPANPGAWSPAPAFPITVDHPVHNVSWRDVHGQDNTTGATLSIPGYLEWAGNLRLPTEAEWEYASRAGRTDAANGTVYGTSPGGISHDLANYDQSDGTTAGTLDQFTNTSPVGTFPANPFGLFDMSGNVWEWCSDWYEAPYLGGAVTDPQGPAGPLQYRLSRGGSWNHSIFYLRSALRNDRSPSDRDNVMGFRVARIPR